jgi:hypothetical protein
MRGQVRSSLVESSQLVAEKYSSRLVTVDETIQIIVETVRDRVVGYPSMDGWKEGKFVPFVDHYTKQPRYPLKQPPVPLVGQIQKELPSEYSDPRIQEYPQLLYSSQTAAYHDSRTVITNGFTTSLVPPSENDGLYNATGDLATFLRPLYEFDPEILRLRITFFADGHGTILQYPAGEIASSYISKGCDWIVQEDNPLTGRPYGTLGHVSQCHFESDVIRPETASSEYNGLDDGTAEWIIKEIEKEIEDRQRDGLLQAGTTTVAPEVRNSIDQVFWTGPKLVSDNSTVVLTAGKAVFDRLTGELIGFVTADLLEGRLAADLDTQVLEEKADVYVVDYYSGIIVSESPGSEYPLSSVLPQFDNIRAYLNFDIDSDAPTWWMRYKNDKNNNANDNGDNDNEMTAMMKEPCLYVDELENGGILTASPLPLPPKPDDPKHELYRPSAFVVQIISNDVFSVVQEIEESINQDVTKNITWSCVAGALGLAVVLVLLSVMSRVLTRPLTWITDVSRQIIYNDYGAKNTFFRHEEEEESYDDKDEEYINNYDRDHAEPRETDRVVDEQLRSTQDDNQEEEGPMFRSEVMQPSTTNGADEDVDIVERINDEDGVDEKQIDGGPAVPDSHDYFHCDRFDDYRSVAGPLRCGPPRTEIRKLVEEFEIMIHSFSGTGPSQVAEPAVFQLKNTLTWHDEFAKLYDSEGLTRRSFRQTSQSTEATETEITDITQQSPPPPLPPLTSQEERGAQQSVPSLRQLIPDKPKSYFVAAIEEEQQPDFQSQAMDDEQKEESDEYLGATLDLRPHPTEFEYNNAQSSTDQVEPMGAQQAEDSGSLTDEEEQRKESAPSARLDSSHRKSSVSFLPPPPPSSKTGRSGRAKIHRNPVLGTPKSEKKPVLQEDGAAERAKVCCSKLFWCIVLLMALPVLLTSMAVSAIASSSISRTLPDWITGAEVASISIEEDTIEFVAKRKAGVFSTLTKGPIRDLHFMNRIANWLYFGGAKRSGTFTTMETGAEACKDYYEAGLSNTECPAFLDLPCSCDWKDNREYADISPSCTSDPRVADSRYLQKQGFSVQKLDADPSTGNRYESLSYPEQSYSPGTTSWWSNISALPGSGKGPDAAGGYATVYDRLAVASASAVYNFPIYNYATSLNRPKDFLANFLTFEDDGGIMGWTGCQYSHTTRSSWVSTVENGGALVNNASCPLGR